MTLRSARRWFLFYLAFCSVLMSAPAFAQQQVGRNSSKQTAKDEKSGPSVGERFVSALLGELDRPQIRLRLNYGNDGKRNEVRAQTQFPLRNDISIPLRAVSGNAQIDQLIPTAVLKTKDVVVRWNANTDAAGNVLSNDIVFLNRRTNTPVELEFDVRSEAAELLSLRISALRLSATGISGDAKDIVIDSSCNLKQMVVDLQTGRQQAEETTCTFKGKYVKDTKKFTYRFVFDSF